MHQIQIKHLELYRIKINQFRRNSLDDSGNSRYIAKKKSITKFKRNNCMNEIIRRDDKKSRKHH